MQNKIETKSPKFNQINSQPSIATLTMFKPTQIKNRLQEEVIYTKDQRRRERLKEVAENIEVLFTKEQVERGIKTLAQKIFEKHSHNPSVVFLTVLNGGMKFSSALLNELSELGWDDFYEDTVKYSSYGNHMASLKSSWELEPKANLLTGRTVICIDDVMDTGNTAMAVKDKCLELGAKEVEFVTLSNKISMRKANIHPTFTYFILEGNKWLIGCGLDQEKSMRNSITIFKLPKAAKENYLKRVEEDKKLDKADENKLSLN
ncbi:MAG: hypothetical protein HYX60_07410 [Legionella longbeachae]|nr:hypothetical protein [Legionella longbeachae]